MADSSAFGGGGYAGNHEQISSIVLKPAHLVQVLSVTYLKNIIKNYLIFFKT